MRLRSSNGTVEMGGVDMARLPFMVSFLSSDLLFSIELQLNLNEARNAAVANIVTASSPARKSETTARRVHRMVRAKKPVRAPGSPATRARSVGRSLHIGEANVQAIWSKSRHLRVPQRNHVPDILGTSCECRTLTRTGRSLASAFQRRPYCRQGSEFPCQATRSRWTPL